MVAEREPYCILCGDYPNDKQDAHAWRYEHDQKEHPTYWAMQVGIIHWEPQQWKTPYVIDSKAGTLP